jgi:hypothetical protein
MTDRRFPPPWTVEETPPCFIVRNSNEQALTFVYCEDEPGRRTTGKLLTPDEARRIAYRRSCSSSSGSQWFDRNAIVVCHPLDGAIGSLLLRIAGYFIANQLHRFFDD